MTILTGWRLRNGLKGAGKQLVDDMKEQESSFEHLPWHDSRLLDVRLVRKKRTKTEDDLECRVDFLVRLGEYRPATVTFVNCTIIKMDIDLDSKRVCGDSVSSATCDLDSHLRDQIEKTRLRDERHPLDGYRHYLISLIPPSGDLNVFAERCDIVWTESPATAAFART